MPRVRHHVRQRRLAEIGANRVAHPSHERVVRGEPHRDVDVLAAALRHRVQHTEVGENRIRRPLAMPLADQRDDGYAHGERLHRAIDPAVGQRIEHEVDQRVARLVFVFVAALRQEQQAIRERCLLPPPSAHRAGAARGCWVKTRASRPARAARTSRHNARQRRDSLSGPTNAPMTMASDAIPSDWRWNVCEAAGATDRQG